MFAVLHQSYLPHLALDKTETLKDTVLSASDGDLVWPTRVVVGTIDKIIPHLSVAIQGTVAMPIPAYALAPKQPRTGLILIAHRKRGIQPVRDVGVPKKRALVVNVHIAESSRVHDSLDRVRLVQEHNLASTGSIIVPTLLECLDDGWCRVAAVEAGLDHTCFTRGGVERRLAQGQYGELKGGNEGGTHHGEEQECCWLAAGQRPAPTVKMFDLHRLIIVAVRLIIPQMSRKSGRVMHEDANNFDPGGLRLRSGERSPLEILNCVTGK